MKYSVIPRPVRYDEKEDSVIISENTAVTCVREFVSVGDELSRYLHTRTDANENEIIISKAKSIAAEGYALYTENGNIHIKASTVRGAYYAFVTLKWILMQVKRVDGKKTLAGFLIEDKPCYRHRGMMLDECRHFFGMQTVKNLLDNMALLKLNVFHWHLADDQGYRIESKAFPRLNEVASKRRYDNFAKRNQTDDQPEYGPFFYTHDEIREIVQYAADRQIAVIPEIDIPGHATAMLAAYPELSCDGVPPEVACKGGIFPSIFCAGKQSTFDFLEKLFDEICPLFPCPYFHIGGDETRYGKWKKCPDCQKTIKENGLKNEKHLQMYFMGRVNEMMKVRGKKCIAWNDCLGDELDSDIVCHYWTFQNVFTVRKQAKKREVILSPMLSFYFNYGYGDIPLKKTYKFNEKSKGFRRKGVRVRGVEAELWTEWIDCPEAVEYSLYPRLSAVAEVAWTPLEKRNFKDFSQRQKFYKLYLKSKGINYYLLDNKTRRKLIALYSHGKDGKEFKRNEKAKAQHR